MQDEFVETFESVRKSDPKVLAIGLTPENKRKAIELLKELEKISENNKFSPKKKKAKTNAQEDIVKLFLRDFGRIESWVLGELEFRIDPIDNQDPIESLKSILTMQKNLTLAMIIGHIQEGAIYASFKNALLKRKIKGNISELLTKYTGQIVPADKISRSMSIYELFSKYPAVICGISANYFGIDFFLHQSKKIFKEIEKDSNLRMMVNSKKEIIPGDILRLLPMDLESTVNFFIEKIQQDQSPGISNQMDMLNLKTNAGQEDSDEINSIIENRTD